MPLEPELIQRRTSLSANIVAFCRFLRKEGFIIGPAEEADALTALRVMAPFQDPANFQLCLRSTLTRSAQDIEKFDVLFEQYWRELEKAVDSKRKDAAEEKPRKGKQQGPSLNTLKSWLYRKGNTEEIQEIATYSAHEVLGRKDFSLIPEEDLREVMKLLQQMSKKLSQQLSRRYEKSNQISAVDLRRTLRQNMRAGGEIVEINFRRHKKLKKNILLICDVSKSMDLYSKFLIQFIYAFQHQYKRIDTFVFSTALHRVSKQLKEKNFQMALARLSEEVPDWSGGTRIGACLYDFCQLYARRLLNKNTTVIILSDGWDTGEIELLEQSLRQIQKKATQLIWLNPLAGNPNYQPKTSAMAAALPYIDIFAPAHNVESLKKLVTYLR